MSIRRHWVIYYTMRRSIISEEIFEEELFPRLRIPRPHLPIEWMLAFAKANAPSHASHFRIAATSQVTASRADYNVTDILPCR